MTRRFVALCLALLLPLQFAWGAAAVHCQHETSPALAAHFGHHAHVHDDAAQKSVGGKLSIDSDCGYCNAATPHAVTSSTLSLPTPVLAPYAAALLHAPARSAPARLPDRPQWRRLA